MMGLEASIEPTGGGRHQAEQHQTGAEKRSYKSLNSIPNVL